MCVCVCVCVTLSPNRLGACHFRSKAKRQGRQSQSVLSLPQHLSDLGHKRDHNKKQEMGSSASHKRTGSSNQYPGQGHIIDGSHLAGKTIFPYPLFPCCSYLDHQPIASLGLACLSVFVFLLLRSLVFCIYRTCFACSDLVKLYVMEWWSVGKTVTRAAESVKNGDHSRRMAAIRFYLLSRRQFSAHTKSSLARIDKRTARAARNTRYRYSKNGPLDHKMADNCVSLARTNTLSSTITKPIKT